MFTEFSWSLNCSELKRFLYVHHKMNSYPSYFLGMLLNTTVALVHHLDWNSTVINVFVYICPLMIVLKLTKENDSDKTLLNFKL